MAIWKTATQLLYCAYNTFYTCSSHFMTISTHRLCNLWYILALIPSSSFQSFYYYCYSTAQHSTAHVVISLSLSLSGWWASGCPLLWWCFLYASLFISSRALWSSDISILWILFINFRESVCVRHGEKRQRWRQWRYFAAMFLHLLIYMCNVQQRKFMA